MAALILEVQARGLNQYHKLKDFPITIGRAFDNDIILSDESVAAHHVCLYQDVDHNVYVTNFDNVPISLNNKTVQQPDKPLSLPSEIVLGNRKLRLLSADTPVATAKVKRCTGVFAPICNPVWTSVLLGLTIFSLVLNNYLDTTLQKDPLFYLSTLLPNVLALLAFTLAISGITRLVTHRWQIIPALNIAALFTLIPLLVIEVAQLGDYFFTSDSISDWLVTITNVILLPLLLFIYLWRVNNQSIRSALGVALLLSSPLLAYQIIDLVDQASTHAQFSTDPTYNQSLSSLDMRVKTATSLEKFLDATKAQLPSQLPAKTP